MQKRKTIKVDEFKAEVNRLLALDNLSQEEKKGLCYLVEKFLLSTGNYKGFIYPAIFTPGGTQWIKDNPYKKSYEYIQETNQEFTREY